MVVLNNCTVLTHLFFLNRCLTLNKTKRSMFRWDGLPKILIIAECMNCILFQFGRFTCCYFKELHFNYVLSGTICNFQSALWLSQSIRSTHLSQGYCGFTQCWWKLPLSEQAGVADDKHSAVALGFYLPSKWLAWSKIALSCNQASAFPFFFLIDL